MIILIFVLLTLKGYCFGNQLSIYWDEFKLTYTIFIFFALALHNKFKASYIDMHRDDRVTPCKNLGNFVPITPEITRLECVELTF